MSASKPCKMDTSPSSTASLKRTKQDPLTPEKMAPEKKSATSNDVMLEEIRALRELTTKHFETTKELKDDLAEINSSLTQFQLRIEKLESRADSAALESAQFQDLTDKRIKKLEQDLEDITNRSRRNNLRIIGLKEHIEGSDMTEFLKKWLPKVLNMDPDCELDIEHSHRVPSHMRLNQSSPRPVVAKFLRFPQALQILTAAKNHPGLNIDGRKILIVPDLAKTTARKRKSFLALRPRLKSLNARYGLQYPARMVVTLNNSTKVFDSPELLQAYLDQTQSKNS
uniref:Uncharacterized protein LOC117360411 n=1 Tax=Geotrypetes seraphini TaxID=260995 RepID=A0A6P8RCY1_GEOSA|nr:uncharacterized protein LOC117360411 [Geotrypetes seraphini]